VTYTCAQAIKEFSKTRLRKRAQSNILKRPHGLGPDRAGGGRGLRSPWSQHIRQLSNQDAAEAKDALFLIREEIAIMKKLNHPNLVSLIEVLDDPEEDSLWMVLEMCKKGVVMKIGLNEDAIPYPEEQCRHWFRDLLMGIEYREWQPWLEILTWIRRLTLSS
jgi:calcium/calmodulin-dependent protein kinase kinase 2